MENPNTMPGNLICLSHLRWDFVYQRPQHLLSRFAKNANVYFYEEHVVHSQQSNYLSVSERAENIFVVVPHLSESVDTSQTEAILTQLFDEFIGGFELDDCLFWYYTPMALKFSSKHKPRLTVYDCMDELLAFKYADPDIAKFEKKLMAKADLVFTGGHSLYEAKKQYHSNIFPFPSSIDKSHFNSAKEIPEAVDQSSIVGPKIGFFGVIDERFDIDLIAQMAEKKPTWQFILIGPVVKIDPEILPRRNNIHYLGQKSYQELPSYLNGWDVALIPFLLNESTRFISPTKTPEYLAASIPVVSTPIRDVVQPYGVKKLVHIYADCEGFISAIKFELERKDRQQWVEKVEHFLENISWDKTQEDMQEQIRITLSNLMKISIAS